MSAGLFLIICYAAAAIYLGYALGVAVERRSHERATCYHTWEYRSLDNLDHFWQRVCLACKIYEKLEREQVPYEIRSRCKDFRG